MHTTFNGKGDTRYIIESHLADNGGRAWSVIEEVNDGRSRVLASGTNFYDAEHEWGHDDLVQFVRNAESRRATEH